MKNCDPALSGSAERAIDTIPRRCDLELNYVEVTKDGKTTRHQPNDKIGRAILKEAQKQFDYYLRQIEEIKTDQGSRDLN